MTSSCKGLGLGLLQCNRTIALEAAQIFYSQNTFAFDGYHKWIPVISWLDAIGDANERTAHVVQKVRLTPLLTGPKDHSAQPRLGTPNTVYILILGYYTCTPTHVCQCAAHQKAQPDPAV